MSRRRRNLTKASRPNIQPAAVFTAEQVAALIASQNQSRKGQPQSGIGGLINALPRAPEVPFGPGIPILPAAIDPVRPDTGRPEPRYTEYPVSINLPGVSDRLVPWKVLRDAAEVPVVRDCIRIRKNQIAALPWDIVITKRAMQQYRASDPDTSSVKIHRELRNKLNPDIARLTEFWLKPDYQQDESFVEWAGKALEEHLVLDALAIYPSQGRNGRLALNILDGSTIKVLYNGRGGKPMPPYPAYQQLIWGFPRGEYIAETDVDGNVINGYSSDRLIYRRREARAQTLYGYSTVEQALQDIDLYLRRHEWDRAQYTDGVQPAGWIKNNGVESWTPQQLAEYTRAFNDFYAGQTLNRMRWQLLPPGMEPSGSPDIPEKFKPDYHLHLIKLLAMHFDVTIAELGFTEAKGLGSAGYHEGQENVQKRKATDPDIRWLQAVITDISRIHLGMPAELEFKFLGLDSEDEVADDELVDTQLDSGRLTLNEAREAMGRPPYNFAEADMPMVVTNRGIVYLDGASKIWEAGLEITPAQAPSDKPSTDTEEPAQPQEDPQVTKAAYGSDHHRMQRVLDQLSEDYPPEALEWIHKAQWSGPVQVPLSRIDYSNSIAWQAAEEPDKVATFERKIRGGWMKPVILVQTPHKKKLIVIDGHHRSMAYRGLNRPVMAWVGKVNADKGPWDEMHASQFHGHGNDDTANTASDTAAKAEIAAYWKWCRNGTSTKRPFVFKHVTRNDAMLHEVDLDRVEFAEPAFAN